MLNLNLNVRPQTAQRLRKLLEFSPDEELFAQNIIAYQVAELKRALLNLRLDLKTFEEKYQMGSRAFYEKFCQGKMGDNEDYMLWAGLVEMLESNEKRLQGLEG